MAARPVHATPADLAADPWGVSPDNAVALLFHASMLVDRETVTAVYPVDGTGKALDSDVLDALRDATCAQAATWAALGIDPVKGAADPGTTAVFNATLGGASITRDSSGASLASATRADYASGLVPAAAQILAAAGLLAGRVRAC